MRIFQQLGKVFKVLKYTNFKKLFSFLDFYECERAIVEGNRTYVSSHKSTSNYSKSLLGNSSKIRKTRERLFHIKIDPENKKIIFESYQENEQVSRNLNTFITEIKDISTLINASKTLGKRDIQDITDRVSQQMGIEVGDATERYK